MNAWKAPFKAPHRANGSFPKWKEPLPLWKDLPNAPAMAWVICHWSTKVIPDPLDVAGTFAYMLQYKSFRLEKDLHDIDSSMMPHWGVGAACFPFQCG